MIDLRRLKLCVPPRQEVERPPRAKGPQRRFRSFHQGRKLGPQPRSEFGDLRLVFRRDPPLSKPLHRLQHADAIALGTVTVALDVLCLDRLEGFQRGALIDTASPDDIEELAAECSIEFSCRYECVVKIYNDGNW